MIFYNYLVRNIAIEFSIIFSKLCPDYKIIIILNDTCQIKYLL